MNEAEELSINRRVSQLLQAIFDETGVRITDASVDWEYTITVAGTEHGQVRQLALSTIASPPALTVRARNRQTKGH